MLQRDMIFITVLVPDKYNFALYYPCLDIMLKEYWDLKNVCDILKSLSNVRTEKLQGSKMSRYVCTLFIHT